MSGRPDCRLLWVCWLCCWSFIAWIAADCDLLVGVRNAGRGQARGSVRFHAVAGHFVPYLHKRCRADYDTVALGLSWSLMLLGLMAWTVVIVQAVGETPRKVSCWRA